MTKTEHNVTVEGKTLDEWQGMNTLRCNMCMWEGEEEDLVMFKDEDGFGKGCPICQTDHYLMDIENNVHPSILFLSEMNEE